MKKISLQPPNYPEGERRILTNPLKLKQIYASDFKSLERNCYSNQPDFIRELRQDSINRFTQLGFPTARMEEWKHTPVKSITDTPYRYSITQPGVFNSRVLTPYLMNNYHRAVILNGQFSHNLSSLDQIPEPITVKNISEAFHLLPDKLIPFLGQIANHTDFAFAALNTAFMNDGVFVFVPDNVIMDTPVHLIYISSPVEKKPLYFPRNLIHLGRNSHATIIEHYIGLSSEPEEIAPDYFSNSVTEFVIEENASVNHIKLQQESSRSNHISTTQFLQDAHSTLSTVSITLGGELTRNEVNVVLKGEGCDCNMLGLVLAREKQHMDNFTSITHRVPHCTSHELYKGIHTDRSHGIFNGRIRVEKNAQKTNAHQINKNILLSKNALVNSNPQLEINADDVKCSHGSSTGQIDLESIFYLRSRGLDLRTAHFLMMSGFASEIIERIKVKPLKKYVSQLLSNWLSDALKTVMD